MSTKAEELKALNAEKKVLNEKQKALRAELNLSKDERKEVRVIQAKARKELKAQKSELRELTAKVYDAFSEGNADTLNELADDIIESATELVGTVRSFAEAAESLEEL